MNLKVIFMGTPEFSKGVLRGLIESDYNVLAVVTQPDKPVGRKRELVHSPVKTLAIEHNIQVIQPNKIKEDYQSIVDLNPDLIITCAYGQIIPEIVLNTPKYGCINVHASLLPKYRGGAPIHYSIINGEKETGVTIMEMVKKMDAGNIISQKAIDIDIKDTTATLFDKLMIVGRDLLLETIQPYVNKEIETIVQNEEEVTFAFNIQKDQEYINFNNNVLSVYNKIRGLISWPVGNSLVDDIRIKFHEVDFKVSSNTKAGFIYGLEGDALKIGAIDGYILVSKLQVAGKSVQTAKEFYNGYKNKVLERVFYENDNK